MELGIILILFAGLLLFMIPLGLVWYMSIGGIYEAIKRAKSAKLFEVAGLSCSVDADCPEGLICISGRCVPQEA